MSVPDRPGLWDKWGLLWNSVSSPAQNRRDKGVPEQNSAAERSVPVPSATLPRCSVGRNSCPGSWSLAPGCCHGQGLLLLGHCRAATAGANSKPERLKLKLRLVNYRKGFFCKKQRLISFPLHTFGYSWTRHNDSKVVLGHGINYLALQSFFLLSSPLLYFQNSQL